MGEYSTLKHLMSPISRVNRLKLLTMVRVKFSKRKKGDIPFVYQNEPFSNRCLQIVCFLYPISINLNSQICILYKKNSLKLPLYRAATFVPPISDKKKGQ